MGGAGVYRIEVYLSTKWRGVTKPETICLSVHYAFSREKKAIKRLEDSYQALATTPCDSATLDSATLCRLHLHPLCSALTVSSSLNHPTPDFPLSLSSLVQATVLGGWKSKMRLPACSGCGEGVADGWFLTGSSHDERGERSLWSLFYKITNPIQESSASMI